MDAHRYSRGDGDADRPGKEAVGEHRQDGRGDPEHSQLDECARRDRARHEEHGRKPERRQKRAAPDGAKTAADHEGDERDREDEPPHDDAPRPWPDCRESLSERDEVGGTATAAGLDRLPGDGARDRRPKALEHGRHEVGRDDEPVRPGRR